MDLTHLNKFIPGFLKTSAHQNLGLKQPEETVKNIIDQSPKTTQTPSGRSSQPDIVTPYNNLIRGATSRLVYPPYLREIIPIIRALVINNPDVGQVVHNVVTLGNTGHKIMFDRNCTPEQVDKMRNHLVNKRKTWATGQAGMNGLVNKWFAQLLIGGALSNEWIVSNKLDGIEYCALVNPENIFFEIKKTGIGYEAYQQILSPFSTDPKLISNFNLIKLNPKTYKYFALNGDTDLPYGIPPYASAPDRIKAQTQMNTNIDFVINQLGIIGFLECLIDKPDKADGETQPQFEARLEKLLDLAKSRLATGTKDGIVAGFNGDHTFNFNSYGKDYERVIELYKNNELQIASGLKQDASLWGRDYNTSESQITVVFMKMLSELRNIQNIIAENLEFGYTLELLLAGFKFDFLKVQFNRSTIQDDLKYQQAEEIKVRNVTQKMILGLIDQDQAADELGYETPAFSEPLVDWEILAGGSTPTDQAGQAVEKQKRDNKSAKKTRDTNKPQGGKK